MPGDENKQNEFLFLQIVSMFQVAALQQLGKLPNPVTNKIERDLEQAKMSVDILAMLKEKTKGNLSEQEEEFLGKVLFESQMNYLDEIKKPGGEESEKTEGETEEKAESSNEKTSEPPSDEKSRDGGDGSEKPE
ncbi:MAG: DUF1844 domain-containing protein [Candidatus Latescibacterota bacterium]|nr:MAG: DUF1844 domain-containing protein [Candidatus Latescibacterota bacterium]